MRKVPYPHPGEILMEEFLKPMDITQYRLAKEIGVPQRPVGEIVSGIRGITVDTGLRLSRFFGMSEDFWMGLQMDYDAALAKETLAKTWQRSSRGAMITTMGPRPNKALHWSAPNVAPGGTKHVVYFLFPDAKKNSCKKGRIHILRYA